MFIKVKRGGNYSGDLREDRWFFSGRKACRKSEKNPKAN
jgi:hypothetical protein